MITLPFFSGSGLKSVPLFLGETFFLCYLCTLIAMQYHGTLLWREDWCTSEINMYVIG